MTISTTIRTARLACGLKQYEVAQALHISPFVYHRLEKGTRRFEARWIPLLPLAMRPTVVRWLIDQTEKELEFIVQFKLPPARVGYKRGN